MSFTCRSACTQTDPGEPSHLSPGHHPVGSSLSPMMLDAPLRRRRPRRSNGRPARGRGPWPAVGDGSRARVCASGSDSVGLTPTRSQPNLNHVQVGRVSNKSLAYSESGH